MTGKDMIVQVNLGLKQLNSKQTKGYYEEEVLIYLNKAQERFIASKVRKVEGKAYDYDLLDEQALLPIKEDEVILTDNNFNDTYLVDNNIAFFVRGSVQAECGEPVINLLKASMVAKAQQTPYFQSTAKNCNAELVVKGVKIYPHKNYGSLKSVTLVYIRKPKEITLSSSCELDTLYHSVIVDLAIGMMKVDDSRADSRLKDEDTKANSILVN